LESHLLRHRLVELPPETNLTHAIRNLLSELVVVDVGRLRWRGRGGHDALDDDFRVPRLELDDLVTVVLSRELLLEGSDVSETRERTDLVRSETVLLRGLLGQVIEALPRDHMSLGETLGAADVLGLVPVAHQRLLSATRSRV